MYVVCVSIFSLLFPWVFIRLVSIIVLNVNYHWTQFEYISILSAVITRGFFQSIKSSSLSVIISENGWFYRSEWVMNYLNIIMWKKKTFTSRLKYKRNKKKFYMPVVQSWKSGWTIFVFKFFFLLIFFFYIQRNVFSLA